MCTQVKEYMKSVSRIGTAKDLKDIEGGCGVKTGTAQSSLNKSNRPWMDNWILS